MDSLQRLDAEGDAYFSRFSVTGGIFLDIQVHDTTSGTVVSKIIRFLHMRGQCAARWIVCPRGFRIDPVNSLSLRNGQLVACHKFIAP